MAASLFDLARRIFSPLIIAILIVSIVAPAANASFFNVLRMKLLVQQTSADLRVEFVTLDRGQAGTGDTLSATIGVANDGVVAATSTLLTLWLSAGSTPSTSDVSRLEAAQLGTVPPKGGVTSVKTFRIPTSRPAGMYRVFATVETPTLELNLGNNTGSATLQVVTASSSPSVPSVPPVSPPPASPPVSPPPVSPPPASSPPVTPPPASPPPVSSPPAPPPPVVVPSPGLKYKAYMDSLLANNSAAFNAQARNVVDMNCGGCIAFQYIVDGVTAMYEGTKDPAYISLALGWAETIIASATITDASGYRNWPGGWASPYSSRSIAFQLDDLLLGPPLARVARVILSDSALKATYGTRAQAVYDFVNRHIADKWLVARDSEAWLLDLASNVGLYPRMSDRVPLLGLMLMDLVAVSPNARYSNDLNVIVAAYAIRLKPFGNGGALWLDVGAPCSNGDSCDTAHAGLYVDFMTRAYEAGLGVTLNQLKGVATLLRTVIWNGSTSNPMFTNWVDGSNDTFRGRGAWSNGAIYTGWQTLARVDPTVKMISSAVLDAIIAGTRNPSLDAMNTIYGQVELAGHLTLAGS